MKKATKREFLPNDFLYGFVEAEKCENSALLNIQGGSDAIQAWYYAGGDNKRTAEKHYNAYVKGLDLLEKYIKLHREHCQAVFDEHMDVLADKGKDGETFNAEKWKLENL